MNSLIFLNTFEFFQNILAFLKISFSNKIRKLLVQSLGKFLSVVWNFVTKTFAKFVTFYSFFKILKKHKTKINSKNSQGFWKINKFIWKKSNLIIYLKTIFHQYVNNFLELLLWTKYVLDILAKYRNFDQIKLFVGDVYIHVPYLVQCLKIFLCDITFNQLSIIIIIRLLKSKVVSLILIY